MDRHIMEFIGETADGEDEYYCNICGRHILVDYEVNPPIVELAKGDIYAYHSGGRGGLQITGAEVSDV